MDSRGMVALIRNYGVKDERVLEAIEKIRREMFVPENLTSEAYEDRPLSIGFEQTISQPYTVARMIELVVAGSKFNPEDSRVLEVGTGSGYQAAVLAKLFKDVYSIERIEELAARAKEALVEAGLDEVKVKVGDGKMGWPEYSPYEAIVVAANAEEIPKQLIDQLKEGGRIVLPVKGMMMKGEKVENKMVWEKEGEFNFVPLV